MADATLRFYQQHGLKVIQSCLQSIAGLAPEFVTNEELFRRYVVERGWDSLPESLRAGTRRQLRWDEILLALQLRVYSQSTGRVAVVPDSADLIAALLGKLLRAKPASFANKSSKKAPPGLARAVDDESPVQPAQAKPGAKPGPAAAHAPGRAGPPGVALGIDLGTTYSVVAHLDAQGRPCCITNHSGDLLTPSVVLFDEAGIVIGKEAIQAASMQPDQVADCVKRHMGARAYGKTLNGYEFPPEVISAFVLRSLKADAENKLGPVTQAVITVPAYFDEARRRATIDAGRLAELDVLDILNEPTAAALAYGYQLGYLDWRGQVLQAKPLRVLVYDLGGGTFDVTIVHLEKQSFKAVATDGDVYLGGKDWDEKLVEIAADRLLKESGVDPHEDAGTMWELWTNVEAAKRTLSERPKAVLFLNNAGQRHKLEVTKAEFEEATAPLVERTRMTTELVVRQAGISWADIDKVLLVGGSTRMPMIPAMLAKLTGKTPERAVSPDEAVAHGAALYADLILQKRAGKGQKSISITNVSSHSLGIVVIDPKTNQRRNQILLPKNTALPASISRTFKTFKANQRKVAIRVVEGESERPEACSKVGVCRIENLPANLPQGAPVQVTYAYGENGRLDVTARLAGHPAVVNTYFLRENKLEDAQLEEWVDWVRNEWARRST